MIFEPSKIDAQEKEVLGAIERLRGELRYAMPLRWFGVMRRNTFARAIRGSNTIEGYNVTMDDAVAAVEEEEPLDAKSEAWLAVSGYRTAMTLVLQKADDPYFKYSPDFLNALQFMMTSYNLSKNPGRWRPGGIFVKREETGEVVYEGPDIDLVPDLMSNLIGSLNSEDYYPPLIKAAMAHLNLVLIHPYRDGNGRMARALQTLVLARSGYALHPIFISIEEYLGRNNQAYYNILAQVAGGKWQPSRSTKPWIRFCLTAHYRQAKTLKQRNQQIERLWDEIEKETVAARLPGRGIASLTNAALGYKIRNPNYRNEAEVSRVVAGRDLKALVRAGLLVAKGEKRGRYYIASQKLWEITSRIPKPKGVEDPFEEKTQPPLPGMD